MPALPQRSADATVASDEPAAGVRQSHGGHSHESARVLIVEDHALLAQSIVFLLRDEGLDASSVIAESLEGVLEAVQDVAPNVVLLDLDLGGAGSGVQLIPDLVALGAAVVIVTGVTDRCRLAECVEQGAVGVVGKGDGFDRVLCAVRSAIETGTAMGVDDRHALLTELRAHRAAESARLAPFERLTPCEIDVLMGLADGLTAAEIAEAGFVSIFTVRGHIRSILSKLGVGTQLAAVARARTAGWLP